MNLDDLSVDDLAQRCADDTDRFHRQLPNDPQFCFELMRRALQQESPEAFTRVYQIYQPQVLSWVYHHTRFEQTGESADYFATQAISSFYFALRGPKFTQFSLLKQVLSYLKTCVSTAIAQYLRNYRPYVETPLGDAGMAGYTPSLDTEINAADLWAHICHLLPDESDRLLVHYVFVLGFKPAQVAARHPEIWNDARTVSVALQRIRRTLRSDSELQEWAGTYSQDDE